MAQRIRLYYNSAVPDSIPIRHNAYVLLCEEKKEVTVNGILLMSKLIVTSDMSTK